MCSDNAAATAVRLWLLQAAEGAPYRILRKATRVIRILVGFTKMEMVLDEWMNEPTLIIV